MSPPPECLQCMITSLHMFSRFEYPRHRVLYGLYSACEPQYSLPSSHLVQSLTIDLFLIFRFRILDIFGSKNAGRRRQRPLCQRSSGTAGWSVCQGDRALNLTFLPITVVNIRVQSVNIVYKQPFGHADFDSRFRWHAALREIKEFSSGNCKRAGRVVTHIDISVQG